VVSGVSFPAKSPSPRIQRFGGSTSETIALRPIPETGNDQRNLGVLLLCLIDLVLLISAASRTRLFNVRSKAAGTSGKG
jgi:hypothetical protein